MIKMPHQHFATEALYFIFGAVTDGHQSVAVEIAVSDLTAEKLKGKFLAIFPVAIQSGHQNQWIFFKVAQIFLYKFTEFTAH